MLRRRNKRLLFLSFRVQRRQPPCEIDGCFHDFIHGFGEYEADVLAYHRHYLFQIGFVVLWNDHRLNSCPVGCHGLFPQASDRQHPAAQRHFSGHGDIVTHRRAGQRRDQRGGDGDAGRRAVLGDRRFREMDMHIHFFVKRRADLQCFGARAHKSHRRLGAFLHDRTQIARYFDLTRAGYYGDFGLQHLAAHAGPGQAVDHADFVAARNDVILEFGRPQKFFQILLRNQQAAALSAGNFPGRLAA